ncbi:hypothetical protein LTR62_006068 [Meristemomyces frigidus]|uniref:DUF2293 domain-containing protein n=1 Tax=Meristemomyces frigidus TaxID=1508187 RepID=A0AAN7TCK5_9PEZI|nr:hypothetical protein LTR62_006068 [Meristemomyces frigidus]
MAPTISSRVASNRPSRAPSSARDIVKKRDRPFKTETQRVLAKRRKLDLHNAFKKEMPAGYEFLPVGTPDLMERCKELSRQRGFPVNVVNSKPVSKMAEDPWKVSYHINRVGYHFRSEILDEARKQLGYVLYKGHLIKAADLEAQRRAAASHSVMANTLAKYGINPDSLKKDAQRESPQQVRAAIKELFPRIPEADLDQIVHHAWEEGTSRVGTNEDLELPRRVQLATIARIRHTYTDYDRLLRAFEWKEARLMVEPDCLRKLIEWRGEHDMDDDNQLEEIVRETIVIDDDDDETVPGMIYDDSTNEFDNGDTSDASVEITHHIAADTDFAAEASEHRPRRVPNLYRPRREVVDYRREIARQKIGAVRQTIRSGAPVAYPMPSSQALPRLASDHKEIIHIDVRPDQRGQYPSEIMVDGRRMFLARNPEVEVSTQPYYPQPPSNMGAQDRPFTIPSQQPLLSAPLQQSDDASRRYSHELHDRPVPSIERHNGVAGPDGPATVYSQGTRAVTPDNTYGAKPPRMDGPLPHNGASRSRLVDDREFYRPQRLQAPHEIIDLVSPVRKGGARRSSPIVLDDYQEPRPRMEVQYGSALHNRPPVPNVPLVRNYVDSGRHQGQSYTSHGYYNAYPVHGAPAPIQQLPLQSAPLAAAPGSVPLQFAQHAAPVSGQYGKQDGLAYEEPAKQPYPPQTSYYPC